jgi:hypothetical protein
MPPVSDQHGEQWIYATLLDFTGPGRSPDQQGWVYATDPDGRYNSLRELGIEAPLIGISPDGTKALVAVLFDRDLLGLQDTDGDQVRGLGREALRRLQEEELAPRGHTVQELVEWTSLDKLFP